MEVQGVAWEEDQLTDGVDHDDVGPPGPALPLEMLSENLSGVDQSEGSIAPSTSDSAFLQSEEASRYSGDHSEASWVYAAAGRTDVAVQEGAPWSVPQVTMERAAAALEERAHTAGRDARHMPRVGSEPPCLTHYEESAHRVPAALACEPSEHATAEFANTKTSLLDMCGHLNTLNFDGPLQSMLQTCAVGGLHVPRR